MKVIKGEKETEGSLKEAMFKADALNEEKLEMLIKEIVTTSMDKRDFYVVTGKEGAIQAEIGFRLGAFEYSKGVLTQPVADKIESTVRGLDWKDGRYGLSTEGLKYLG